MRLFTPSSPNFVSFEVKAMGFNQCIRLHISISLADALYLFSFNAFIPDLHNVVKIRSTF